MPKKIKKIPMSHQFLTGMVALLHPKMTGGLRWDCVPYSADQIQKILKHPQFMKDFYRSYWYFGKQKKERNLNQAKHEKKETWFILKETSADIVGDFIAGAKKIQSDSDKKEIELNLNREEASALLAFSMSVGNGGILQGGTTRGVFEACFHHCWLLNIYGYNIIGKNESNKTPRIERLENSAIKVSSQVEISEVLDLLHQDSPPITHPGKKTNLIQFYNERRIKKSVNQEGSFFSIVPHSQVLEIEESFWEHNILKRAKQRLAGMNHFLPVDFFAFIPCLGDQEFRKIFCEKIAKRSGYEYDFAIKWIKLCYNDQNKEDELNEIVVHLTRERAKAQQAGQIQAFQLENPADFVRQAAYASEKAFFIPAYWQLVGRNDTENNQRLAENLIKFYSGKWLEETVALDDQAADLPEEKEIREDDRREKIFWDKAIIPFAKKRLAQEEAFESHNMFALMLCLRHKEFRQLFYTQLEQQAQERCLLLALQWMDMEPFKNENYILEFVKQKRAELRYAFVQQQERERSQHLKEIQRRKWQSPLTSLINIPISHHFLTHMMALLNQSQTGGPQWDCMPYTSDQIEKILANPECKADIDRSEGWHFGKRRLENNVDEAEEVKDKEEDQKLQGENNLESIVAQLKTGAKQHKLNLTEAEVKALLAFNLSIRDGWILQGGAIRGVRENCFNYWLHYGYGYVINGTAYQEELRVERLEQDSSSIQVSSCVEAREIFDARNSMYPIASDSEDLIQFCSEQQLTKTEPGEFRLTPSRQTLRIEETFLKNRIIPRAIERLQAVSHFVPTDFFYLIPYLCDDDFRKLFCEKIARRPQCEFNFARYCIELCYDGKGQDSELYEKIKTGLNLEREAFFALTETDQDQINQDILLQQPADLFAQLPYFGNKRFVQQVRARLVHTRDERLEEKLIEFFAGDKRALDFNAIMLLAQQRLKQLTVFNSKDLFALILCLSDETFRKLFCKKLATRPQSEYLLAVQWIEACANHDCYVGQAKEFRDSLTLLKIKRKKTLQKQKQRQQYTFAVIAAGLLLATVGATLAATGVLAPLGFAIGGAGLSLATPAAAAIVGGICFASPTILSVLVFGFVRLCKSLFNCICNSGGSGRRLPAPHQDVASSSTTARTIKHLKKEGPEVGQLRPGHHEAEAARAENNFNEAPVLSEQAPEEKISVEESINHSLVEKKWRSCF